MKRFLVAIIVVLMSTVAFAQDKMPAAGFVDGAEVDLEEMVFRTSAETAVNAIFEASGLFPEGKRKEVVLALVDLHEGLYAGHNGNGCLVVSVNEEDILALTEKLPPPGGGSCEASYCTSNPSGAPYAYCSVGPGWYWQYCDGYDAMACCGYRPGYPTGSGFPCGFCLSGWPW